MNDDEARIDRDMRRAGRRSVDEHRRSVADDDVEAALLAVHDIVGGGSPTGGDHRTRRRGVLVGASVAVVTLVVGLAVVGGDADRNVATSPSAASSTEARASIEDSQSDTSSPPPTTSSAGGVAAPIPAELPSTFLDRNGDLIGGPVGSGGEGGATAFLDVVRDHLLHRSDVLGDSVGERERALEAGGLRIWTTFDPEIQRAATNARSELPANSGGFDAAIVSLDTTTGAVRAIVGRTDSTGTNMAVTPRQTGSAIGFFVVAAATEVGVRGDDLVDGIRGCRFPTGDPSEPVFQIVGGIAGFVGSVHDIVARSALCGTTRLSYAVGVEEVVDTIERMAASDNLGPSVASGDRLPIDPFPSLAVGANELSALDMASGMQTVANEGVHHEPYFVDSIEDPDGANVFMRETAGSRELGRAASLETVDILRGVLTYGTGRRHELADGRPAIGITGTQQDNMNAWFVGATPQLTTAVWVGDPDAYTPMINVPEFVAVDVPRVQGGTFPGQIWKAVTDAALAEAPAVDWESPPPLDRPAVRVVIPEVECLAGELDGSGDPTRLPIEPAQPLTTVDTSVEVLPCDRNDGAFPD